MIQGRRYLKILSIAMTCVVVLAACGKGKEIKKEPPMPLPKITAGVELKKLWSRDTGSGSAVFGIGLVPAVQDGRLYTADAEGRVMAIESASGEQVWQTRLDARVSGGVGVGDDIVVVGTPDGKVLALSMEDGAKRWEQQVVSEVLAPPAVGSGVVVVRTVDGSITGLSAADGTKKWIFRRPVPGLTLRGSGTPVLVQGAVIAGFADGKIVAANVDSGSILWDAQVAYARGRNEVERLIDIDGRPLLVGSVLYVASYQGRVLSMALGSRRVVWARDLSSYVDLGADTSNLYVSDDGGVVHALDRLTGSTVWKQENLQRRQLTGPAVIGDYVAVGDYQGYIHLLNRSDGSLAGQTRISSAALRTTPLTIGDTMFVLAQDGSLTALQLQN